MARRIPNDLVEEDLAEDETPVIRLLPDEKEAFLRAQDALLEDLSFEHLDQPVGDRIGELVWRFLCQCFLDHTRDFVPLFMEEHGQSPSDHVCYMPVEFLKVDQQLEALGLRLLPVTDPRIPPRQRGFNVGPPFGSVAAVPVRGTNYGRMADRARAPSEHALGVLRVALRSHRFMQNDQVRFRLTAACWFDDGAVVWRGRTEEASLELTLNGELLELAASQQISKLPAEAGTDVERKANLALSWIERAIFANDPVTALLYLFFALEALLGRKSEGLKGEGLAFRRALLSFVTRGHFTHPTRTYLLYDKVRSAAVHGEEPPVVGWKTVGNLALEIRAALNEFLEFASDQGVQTRKGVLRKLQAHPRKAQLIERLRDIDAGTWVEYLEKNP